MSVSLHVFRYIATCRVSSVVDIRGCVLKRKFRRGTHIHSGDTATHNAHCDSGHVRRTMANVDVVSGCLGRSKVVEEEIQLYFFVFPQGGNQL